MLCGGIIYFFFNTHSVIKEIGTEVIYSKFRFVLQFSEWVCLCDDGYIQWLPSGCLHMFKSRLLKLSVWGG